MKKRAEAKTLINEPLSLILFAVVVILSCFAVVLNHTIQELKNKNSALDTRETLLQAEVNALNKCVDNRTSPCKIIFN